MARGASDDKFSSRIRWIGIGLALFGGLVAGRVFYIQIFWEDYYKALAQSQYENGSPVIYQRGSIYFKEKNGNLFSAAALRSEYYAAINPKILDDPEETFQRLKEFADLDQNQFLAKAAKKDDPFEIIARRLDKETADKIANLKIGGVSVLSEEKRFYPGGRLASHLLGFVGYEGDQLNGRYGLERFYEELLVGNSSRSSDIITAIEPQVQKFLDDALQKTAEKWSVARGGGIIVNPKTGEILAMAVKPDFDPNSYGNETDLNIFVNPLVENVFEMGSVFKPITLSIALDQRKITPETTYFDEGFVILNGKRLENYDGKGRGMVNMQKVLNESLNTGAVFMMQKAGKENFYDYLLKFGLGERTGIDLPGEVQGNLYNLDYGRDIEYATASFGQGIAVTPMELTMALSAIANGGELIFPRVVNKVAVPGSFDIIKKPEKKRRVISEETSETVTRMLVKVVDEALLGGTVALPHYSVAAKTGTAQIPKKDGKGYSDEFLHSFFGYAPAFDPEFLIFLYLENPQGVRYASQSLALLFMDTTKFLINYYEVPPDR